MEKLLAQVQVNRQESVNTYALVSRRENGVMPKVESASQTPIAPQKQEAQTESAQDSKFRRMRDLRRRIDVINSRISTLSNERRELQYGPMPDSGYTRTSERGVAGLTQAGVAVLGMIIFGNALMFNVTIFSISVPAFALVAVPIFAYCILKGVVRAGRAIFKEISSYCKGREIRRLEKEKVGLILELQKLDPQ